MNRPLRDPDAPLVGTAHDRTDEILIDIEPSAGETPPKLPVTLEFVPKLAKDAITLTDDGNGPSSATPVEAVRDAVPGYEILQELGRGGMGVVYLARQIALNRPVALKMILSGDHAGPGEKERLRREAEAVAALQHPNIVQIYEVGEADGRPYLALEYVSGGSLAARLDGSPWPARPAASLVETLAGAMHFAHQQGIVHRDLKPANILLGGEVSDWRSTDSAAERSANRKKHHTALPLGQNVIPKVTDYGLAKRVEPSSSWSDDRGQTPRGPQTRTGAVVGTPSYIAPEQAAGKNRTVGPAADIYALGTILYELLTGRPPFRGETPLDTVLQVMADDPVPPSKLRAKLPRDLEIICLKCLQKEPRKRYVTAADLADDLGRFQRGDPIAARPIGRRERLGKFIRRHPAAAVLAMTSAAAVIALLFVSLYFNVELRQAAEREEERADAARIAELQARSEKMAAESERAEAQKQREIAETARQDAEKKKREADRGVFALQLFKAAALVDRDPQRALRLLDDRSRCPDEFRDFTWRHLRDQCRIAEQVIGGHAPVPHDAPLTAVEHSPDGSMVVSAGWFGGARVWDVGSRRLIYTLEGHRNNVLGVAFAADGRTLATSGDDNTICLWELPHNRPKDVVTLRPYAVLRAHRDSVRAVAFDPSGDHLASASADGTVRLWDIPPIAEGRVRGTPRPAGTLTGHKGPVCSIVWSVAALYSGGQDGTIRKWDAEDGGDSKILLSLKGAVLALATSSDGEYIAAGGDGEDDWSVYLYRVHTEKDAGRLRGHTSYIHGVSFSQDGKRLASCGRDGTVRLWDVNTLQERGVFRPEKDEHDQPLSRTGRDSREKNLKGISFSPSDLSLVSAGQDGLVRRWNLPSNKDESTDMMARAPLAGAVASRDGQTLVMADRSTAIKLWKLSKGVEEIPAAPTRTLLGLNRPAHTVAVSDDGTTIAAAADDDVITIWHLKPGAGDARPTRIPRTPAVSLAIHANSLIVAAEDGHVRWFDLTSGKIQHDMIVVKDRPTLIAVSPDGRKVVTSGGTMGMQIWDSETGESLFSIGMVHMRPVTAIAIAPGDTNGSWTLATADIGGEVRIWNVRPRSSSAPATGQTLEVTGKAVLSGLTEAVRTVSFSTDGRTLVTGGADRVPRLWDPEMGQERAALAGHADTVLLALFRSEDAAF